VVPHARGVYTPGVRGYNYPQIINTPYLTI
jgi:hypothetical protein